MKKITQETIERVKEEVSIIDVIENYTRVVKKGYGSSYLGFCPFHNDVKNPSMSIDADKKLFHCFTCSEGGNLFQFIQKKENVGFADSVLLLAEKYNIPVEYENPDDDTAEQEKISYYKLLKAAEDFFKNELTKSKEAQEYLSSRNFAEETIKEWGLGWAPGGFSLINHLKKLGYDVKDIEEVGLANFNENKKIYQDTFFSRLIFPIRDVLGRPIGFGGRTLEKDGKPKYLNSKENPVFHKRRTLFGLNLARKEIQKLNEVIVTEGYVDTIMLWQHGIHNVVAALGTAFTVEHILTLSRMTKNIYLCLDADKAGQAATKRGIDLLENTDADVYVIEIPQSMAKDPDEFLQKYSVEEFQKIKEKAISIQKFIVKNMLNEYDLSSPNTRSRAYSAVMEFMKEYIHTFTIFQGIDVCEYMADKLDMPVSGYELYNTLIKDKSKAKPKTENNNVNQNSKIIDASLELNLLRLIYDWPLLLKENQDSIKEEYFVYKDYYNIYQVLKEIIEESNDVKNLSFDNPEMEKTWTKFLMTYPSTDLNEKQAEITIKRMIASLKRNYLQKKLESLQDNDEKDLDEIFKIKLELSKIPLTF